MERSLFPCSDLSSARLIMAAFGPQSGHTLRFIPSNEIITAITLIHSQQTRTHIRQSKILKFFTCCIMLCSSISPFVLTLNWNNPDMHFSFVEVKRAVFPPIKQYFTYFAKLAHLALSVWWWKRLLRVMWCFWSWSTPGWSFEKPKLQSKSTILMSVFMELGSSNWCWYANSDCKRRIAALWTDFKTALRLRLLAPNRPSDI